MYCSSTRPLNDHEPIEVGHDPLISTVLDATTLAELIWLSTKTNLTMFHESIRTPPV
jgi:hypothetical protein